MLFDPFVIFDAFHDGIQDIFSNTQVGFDECHKLFTIVWIDPHAVLKAEKSVFAHKSAQTITGISPVLWDIKHNEPVTLVPSLFTFLLVDRFYFL